MLLMFWSNFSLYPLWICECMNVHKLKYDRVPTWKKREYFYKSRSSHVYYFMRKSRFMNDISGCINSLLFLERQNNFCAKRVECNSYCSKIRMVKLELFKFMKTTIPWIFHMWLKTSENNSNIQWTLSCTLSCYIF